MIEPIEQKTKEPKLFKWALWWGIGIVVVCLTILIINGENTGDLGGPIMNALYSTIYRYGLLPFILFVGLIGPIMEEIVFRSWGNGKTWTGITSVLLMAIFTYSVGWWLSLLTIACGAIILICFRDDRKKKLFCLIILSSVLFAVAHSSNYKARDMDSYCSFLFWKNSVFL